MRRSRLVPKVSTDTSPVVVERPPPEVPLSASFPVCATLLLHRRANDRLRSPQLTEQVLYPMMVVLATRLVTMYGSMLLAGRRSSM